MSQPVGLIQLVGEETLPSVMTMLALKPAGVTHIVSRSFERQSTYAMRAADSAGAAPEPDQFTNVVLGDMPSMSEANRAVSKAIADFQRKGHRPVLNFTGGTKLMAVGAFQAASSAAVTSLYVDGEHGCFCEGQTGPPLANLLSNGLKLDLIGDQLSVKLIATANGCELQGQGHRFDTFLPLSRHLLTHPDDAHAAWKATHGPGNVFEPANRMPNEDRGKWVAILKTEFRLPRTILEMATSAGLVEVCGELARIRSEVDLNSSKQIPLVDKLRLQGDVQSRLNFFGGGWWEVAVAGAVAKCTAFRDVRWSAEVAKEHQPCLEEDILAIQGIQLAYFSCKRGSQRGVMRQLEEVDASARRVGGRMARKYFCVCHLGKRLRDDVRSRAKQLRIGIVTDVDVVDLDDFLKRGGL